MTTILNKIIAFKRDEVVAAKSRVSIKKLEQSAFFSAPRKSFAAALKGTNKPEIIAEFKRSSPSKGVINADVSIADVAAGYERAGAGALSILTDREFFGGSNADLETAAQTVQIPILRKDFVVDEYQIIEARAIGAAAILLIAAALQLHEIESLAKFARKLEIEVLLEVHDAREVPNNLENINAIGVNNRNLHDFSVDTNRSLEVASKLPAEIVKVSESGISDAPTIHTLKRAGFDAFLIGETFMKTAAPAAACAELIRRLQTPDFAQLHATND